jgi:hypothetical protein
MSTFAKQIQIDMIQQDLQQALDCLPDGHYDASIHHLDEAKAKVEQMKTSEPAPTVEPTKPNQVTLDIE